METVCQKVNGKWKLKAKTEIKRIHRIPNTPNKKRKHAIGMFNTEKHKHNFEKMVWGCFRLHWYKKL
jgi:hypothetical protein